MKRMLFVFSLIFTFITVPAFAGLSDTGQTTCYSNSAEITCTQPGEPFYGQDAQYGPNLQSFTKLDDNGTALPDNATTWAMVRDNVTGLEWQQATAPGPGEYTWQQAIDYCAGLSLGGHDDWRLPTVKELSTLVDSSIPYPGPTINTSYFPGTQAFYYWSSTPYAYNPEVAWYVLFRYGGVSSYGKYYGFYVRAVRAGQSGLFDDSFNFEDNSDGTVTDMETGLMWQQATAPGTYTWEQALAYCETLSLAGHSDWRLPNRNELQTLVDYSRYNPAIDTSYFPGTLASLYWSSTTYAHDPSTAWGVSFLNGGVVYGSNKGYYYYVRAVRAGQCGSFGDSDSDSICDDGDNSSIVGDNTCTGGQAENCDDNCLSTPNGPYRGTCANEVSGVFIGTGVTCFPGGTECPTGQTCQMSQEDLNSNGIGDACECYADCDHSGKVNTTDLGIMKKEFFRTNCATVPCQADLNGDDKVNTSDLGIMKVQFFKTGCPVP